MKKHVLVIFIFSLSFFSCKTAQIIETTVPVEEDKTISENEIFSDNSDENKLNKNDSLTSSNKSFENDNLIFEPEVTVFTDDIPITENSIPSEPVIEKTSNEEFSENELNISDFLEYSFDPDNVQDITVSVLEPEVQKSNSEINNNEKNYSGSSKQKSTSINNSNKNNSSLKEKQNTSTSFFSEPEVTIAFNTDTKKTEEKTVYNDAVKCHNQAGNEFKKKNYKKSLELTDYYLLHFTDYLDEMLYLKGQILEILSVDGNGDIIQAKDCYEKLVSLYPQSKWYFKAQERIKYIDRFYFNVW